MSFLLYNPLSRNIEKQYHLDNEPKTYILKAEKITKIENEVVFNHLRDYLVEVILNDRNIVHFESEREKVREEIVKSL